MPAVSKNQRIAMAIREHHPEKLYPRNRGLLKMSKRQTHDFATTPEKGLPTIKKTKKTTKRKGRSRKIKVPSYLK